MVYATLFGIADKVLEQFKKVYPEKIHEFETYNRNVIIAHSYYRSMYRFLTKSNAGAKNKRRWWQSFLWRWRRFLRRRTRRRFKMINNKNLLY